MYVGSMMSEDYTNCHSFLLAYEDEIGLNWSSRAVQPPFAEAVSNFINLGFYTLHRSIYKCLNIFYELINLQYF